MLQDLRQKVEGYPDWLFSLVLAVGTISSSIIIYLIGENLLGIKANPSSDNNLATKSALVLIWKFFFDSVVVPVIETYIFHKWPITFMKHLKWKSLVIIGVCAVIFVTPHFFKSMGGLGIIPLAIVIPYAYLSRIDLSINRAFFSAALIHIYQNTFFIILLYVKHFWGL